MRCGQHDSLFHHDPAAKAQFGFDEPIVAIRRICHRAERQDLRRGRTCAVSGVGGSQDGFASPQADNGARRRYPVRHIAEFHRVIAGEEIAQRVSALVPILSGQEQMPLGVRYDGIG